MIPALCSDFREACCLTTHTGAEAEGTSDSQAAVAPWMAFGPSSDRLMMKVMMDDTWASNKKSEPAPVEPCEFLDKPIAAIGAASTITVRMRKIIPQIVLVRETDEVSRKSSRIISSADTRLISRMVSSVPQILAMRPIRMPVAMEANARSQENGTDALPPACSR